MVETPVGSTGAICNSSRSPGEPAVGDEVGTNAEAVPAELSPDKEAPALAAGYCTYNINGTFLLTCYWSKINANSHVFVAISEYANGNPADRFIGAAQMTVFNIPPFNGGVTAEVNVNWGSPLNVRLDVLTD